MFDLFNEARTIVSETFLSYEIYLTTGAIYLAVTLTLSLLVTALERRLARPG
jgi:polar amino acid transport system permease protein